MEMGYKIVKRTQEFNPESHIHEFYEIFISLTDEGKFFVGEQSYPLSVGTAFFLNPFEIHHCFGQTKKDYDRYVIHFTREYLRKISTEKTDMVALFDSAPLVQQFADARLADLLGQLALLIKPAADEFGADVERNIHFELYLLTMVRSIDAGNGYQPAYAKRETRVNDVLSYIHKHYAEEIVLDDLCKQFFISKSRLSQIFKSTTGFSIGNYVIIYRMKLACALLANGESVQNVGRMVGFKNNTHFIRMFKKHMGCSPGRFSRGNGNETESETEG